jgi:hypothetical protein
VQQNLRLFLLVRLNHPPSVLIINLATQTAVPKDVAFRRQALDELAVCLHHEQLELNYSRLCYLNA